MHSPAENLQPHERPPFKIDVKRQKYVFNWQRYSEVEAVKFEQIDPDLGFVVGVRKDTGKLEVVAECKTLLDAMWIVSGMEKGQPLDYDLLNDMVLPSSSCQRDENKKLHVKKFAIALDPTAPVVDRNFIRGNTENKQL